MQAALFYLLATVQFRLQVDEALQHCGLFLLPLAVLFFVELVQFDLEGLHFLSLLVLEVDELSVDPLVSLVEESILVFLIELSDLLLDSLRFNVP